MQKESLGQYSLSTTFSDLKLISGLSGEEYPTHKIIMASSSNYVKELLDKTPEIKKINLPKPIKPSTEDQKTDPTSKIISFCYGDYDLKELKENGFGRENCLLYFSLAQSLQMKKLEKLIQEYISQNLLNPESAAKFYLEASKFETQTWKNESLEKLAKNLGNILEKEQETDNLLNLPLEPFCEILKRDDISLENEDPLLDLVLKYIQKRENLPEHPEILSQRENEKKSEKEKNEEGEEENKEEEPVQDKPKETEEKKEEGEEEKGGEKEQEKPANEQGT